MTINEHLKGPGESLCNATHLLTLGSARMENYGLRDGAGQTDPTICAQAISGGKTLGLHSLDHLKEFIQLSLDLRSFSRPEIGELSSNTNIVYR